MPTIRIGGALMLAIATVGFLVRSRAPRTLRCPKRSWSKSQSRQIPRSSRRVTDGTPQSIRSSRPLRRTIRSSRIQYRQRQESVRSPCIARIRLDRNLSVSRQSFPSARSAIVPQKLPISCSPLQSATFAPRLRSAIFSWCSTRLCTDVNAENVQNLDQVVRVAETAYSASAVQQTDVISAEFNLATARQFQRQYLTAVANDKTALNLELYRPVGSPFAVDQTLKLEALNYPLDALIDRAYAARQEILEAALSSATRTPRSIWRRWNTCRISPLALAVRSSTSQHRRASTQ